MDHPRAVIAALLALPFFGWLYALAQAPQENGYAPGRDFVIETTSRLVLLDVSVTDARGGFVGGLTENDFKVYEDGKQQKISQFANVDLPVTVGIVVDQSGSMQPKRPEVVTAALGFIHESNPHDEIFVVNFNDKVRFGLPQGVPFSDNAADLRSALWAGQPGGRTALYDGIAEALHQLDLGHHGRKTLIVISDGGDNASRHENLIGVMHDVLVSRATIYAVGIYDEDDPDRNPQVLSKLARTTGGEAYFPKMLDEVIPICRKIAKDVRTRYTIGYIPATAGKTQRSIRVTAATPQSGKLVVRTRTSYLFSPDTAGNAEGR